MDQIQPQHTGENVKLNERLWQAWVCKNRELDKAAVRKRWRLLQVVLGIVVLGAIVQSFIR